MLHQHFDPLSSSPVADPLQTFVHGNRKELTRAAGLLAGSSGTACVEHLVAAIARSGLHDAATTRHLRRLLDILSLEHVHDDRRPEAGFFAAINPADPFVETICLLTDGLRAAVSASARLTSPRPTTV